MTTASSKWQSWRRASFGFALACGFAAVAAAAQPAAPAPPTPPYPPQPGQTIGPANQSGPLPVQPPSAAPPARSEGCAWARRITGWQRVDDQSIIITVGASRRFRVTFAGGCPASRWAVGMRTPRSFGACLSAGDTISFSDSPFGTRDPFMQTGCMVGSVTRL